MLVKTPTNSNCGLCAVRFEISAAVNCLLTPYRDITRNEFIVPMGDELRGLYKDNLEMGNSMKSLQYLSVRPKMTTSQIS